MSVCLLQCGILLKWLNLSKFFHSLIASVISLVLCDLTGITQNSHGIIVLNAGLKYKWDRNI